MKHATPQYTRVAGHAFFFRPPRHLDVVVFVHGITGDSIDTWKKFPALVASDPDLPDVDILLWGYRTGIIDPTVESVETEGRHLASALMVEITPPNSIHLVGHSMGGLVIFQALLHLLGEERGQEHPLTCVAYISLFASPVHGSEKAALADRCMIANKQLESLAASEEFSAFMQEVERCVYSPTENTRTSRKVPVRMVLGTRDLAVDVKDSLSTHARFKQEFPLQLDFDHRGIKEPDSHTDVRYRALTRDLQAGFFARFREVCVALLGADPQAKAQAELEFSHRYERILRSRFEQAGYNVSLDYKKLQEFYELVINAGATQKLSSTWICLLVNMVMDRLVKKWRR